MSDAADEPAPTSSDIPASHDRVDQVRLHLAECGVEWDATWEFVAQYHPDFVETYGRMRAVPRRKGHLPARLARLAELTVNAAATHLNVAEIEPALRRALAAGATTEEVLECLELAATVGIHAMNIGVPLLVEVLEEQGRTAQEPLGEYQEELRARFTRERGYWHDFWNDMLELDPEMFDAYLDFSTAPWHEGSLSPAEKELIYISYDVAATHLYVPGTKLHIRNALRHGATIGQVLEVMEIASMIGIQGLTATVPHLIKRMEPGQQRSRSQAPRGL